ncbi:MAG: hypothetical protein JWP04_3871 [Belnapia sp.]|nr:hypothetical protein [Belnapia sp.]
MNSNTDRIGAAVAAYDAWLATHCAVVPGALAAKRRKMAKDPFAFLRATCFRFVAQYPVLDLPPTPAVPSCGDAHLANFGTWRDAEGRLAWGVNDLDDCALLPWTVDLVRLVASALLAPAPPRSRVAAATVLAGYEARLAAPRGFVLDEEHVRLREFAAPMPAARAKFWAGIDALPGALPPAEWQAGLRIALPEGAAACRFAAREAGLGGLGRPRFVAIAEWRGGRVVREAKARVPSSWIMAGFPGAAAVAPEHLASVPARVPDPWLRFHPGYVVRRLAPDSDKLAPPEGDAAGLLALLEAMGGELANLHASAGGAAAVQAALAAMPADWLRDAAKRMAALVTADWEAFRKG